MDSAPCLGSGQDARREPPATLCRVCRARANIPQLWPAPASPAPPGGWPPPGTTGQHTTGFVLCPPLWMNSFHRGASREMRGEISPGQHRAGPSLSEACSVAQAAQLPAAPLLPHRRDESVPPAGRFHLPRWATPRN